MNKVILLGRLTRDPEIRATGEGLQIASYSLAVDRRSAKTDQADFINIKAFGKAAEFVEKHLTKGMKILISGRIQTGSYTNKEGRKVNTFDVIAEDHEFVEPRRADNAEARTEAKAPVDDGFMKVDDGVAEELPFI